MCEGCGMLTLFSVEEYGIFFIFGDRKSTRLNSSHT